MKKTDWIWIGSKGWVVLIGLLFATAAMAAPPEDMGGWGKDSPYNQLYNARELDSFKGRVVKVTEIVPMKGMSPGVAILVSDSEDEVIEVQVCPTWYKSAKKVSLRRDDRVKVRGVWAEIDGKDVFMASKIKKEDSFVLKVRLTKDGTPFWTMSPEQLAEEIQDIDDD